MPSGHLILWRKQPLADKSAEGPTVKAFVSDKSIYRQQRQRGSVNTFPPISKRARSTLLQLVLADFSSVVSCFEEM